MTFLLILKIVVKIVAFMLLCLTTSYVVLYGKKGTGIKRDYIFTAIFLITLMVLMS